MYEISETIASFGMLVWGNLLLFTPFILIVFGASLVGGLLMTLLLPNPTTKGDAEDRTSETVDPEAVSCKRVKKQLRKLRRYTKELDSKALPELKRSLKRIKRYAQYCVAEPVIDTNLEMLRLNLRLARRAAQEYHDTKFHPDFFKDPESTGERLLAKVREIEQLLHEHAQMISDEAAEAVIASSALPIIPDNDVGPPLLPMMGVKVQMETIDTPNQSTSFAS